MPVVESLEVGEELSEEHFSCVPPTPAVTTVYIITFLPVFYLLYYHTCIYCNMYYHMKSFCVCDRVS